MKTDMADRVIASFNSDDVMVLFGLKQRPTQNLRIRLFDEAERVQILKSFTVASTVFTSFVLC